MAESVETTVAEPTFSEAGPLAVPANRTTAGRFVPGHSGNPNGRPKSATLAAIIKERTGDGDELVAFALKVLRSSRWEPRLRLQAMEWLADRGFGRAIVAHEVTGEDGGPLVVTLVLGDRDQR